MRISAVAPVPQPHEGKGAGRQSLRASFSGPLPPCGGGLGWGETPATPEIRPDPRQPGSIDSIRGIRPADPRGLCDNTPVSRRNISLIGVPRPSTTIEPHHDRDTGPDRRQSTQCPTIDRPEDPGGEGPIEGQCAQAWALLHRDRARGSRLAQGPDHRLFLRAEAAGRVSGVDGQRGRRALGADRPLRADRASGPRQGLAPGRVDLGRRPQARSRDPRREAGQGPRSGRRDPPSDPPRLRLADPPMGPAGRGRRGQHLDRLDPRPGPARLRPAHDAPGIPVGPPAGPSDEQGRERGGPLGPSSSPWPGAGWPSWRPTGGSWPSSTRSSGSWSSPT